MNKRIPTLALTLVMALVTALLTGAATAQEAGSVPRPKPRLGDSRSYTVKDARTGVVVREEETVVTVASEDRVEILDRKRDHLIVLNGTYQMLQNGPSEYAPPVAHLQFPMDPGKRWAYKAAFVHPTCGKTDWDMKNQVLGWEDVKVPAGAFRALRVESKGRWRNSCSGDEIAFKFWYVPEVRGVVRTEYMIYNRGQVLDATNSELSAFKLVND